MYKKEGYRRKSRYPFLIFWKVFFYLIYWKLVKTYCKKNIILLSVKVFTFNRNLLLFTNYSC